MKRVLFIGRRHAGEKNDVGLLAEAIAKHTQGLVVEYGFFEDVGLLISNENIFARLMGERQLTLEDFDVLVLIGWSHERIYADLAGALAVFAKSKNIEVWNTELCTTRSMTKVSQMMRAAFNGISIPKTAFSLDKKILGRLIDENMDYPLVLKDAQASRGRHNYLIEAEKDKALLLEKTKNIYFLAQEFIENDHSDLRILIAGAKPVLCIKRIGLSGSHLHNVSVGARAELVDMTTLPQALKDDAEKVARIFKRELAGADFIKDRSGRFIFLEVNLTPQIVNGVFVDEKVKAIAKTLRDVE